MIQLTDKLDMFDKLMQYINWGNMPGLGAAGIEQCCETVQQWRVAVNPAETVMVPFSIKRVGL